MKPAIPLENDAVILARRLASRLIAVRGVVAVALGGSHARGTASAESDVDLGIYYEGKKAPSIKALRELAAELDDERRRDVVTGYGEWGLWVNGGAWLQVEGRPLDWLYREVGRVRQVIEDCRHGRVTCDYYLGHPHGFHNHIYMGEVHYAMPLEDPRGVLAELKGPTENYPPAMRAEIVRKYLYDARFMLEVARKSAVRGDVMHLSGCLFRVVAAVVQVLFAVNERYFVNEKGSVREVEGMRIRPDPWLDVVDAVLGRIGTEPPAMGESLGRAESLVAGVEALCAGEGLG
ncbi:MAG TPA: nucleotidyltransferase domain-containing protein [Tepidiformaceae bacterium]|nr:nucleotidyltransferase domain-containing protein [Tepidiformaceae bacterium]